MKENFEEMLVAYFRAWEMIPLWVSIPLCVLVVYLVVFRQKAPQRIVALWVLTALSVFNKQVSDVKYKQENEVWLNKCADIALCSTNLQFPSPPKAPPELEPKPENKSSFHKAYAESRLLRIVVWLAVLVTLAEIIILPLKALNVF